MTTCILHVGMHKTGSSSIQQTLSKFNSQTDQYGYADFGNQKRGNHGTSVALIFSPLQRHFYKRFSRNISKVGLCKKRDKIKKSFVKNIQSASNFPYYIISGEGISVMENDALRHLKHFLSQHFSKISVIAYIRQPASYMASAFQQTLKRQERNFDLQDVYPNYQNKFEKFEKCFGINNVTYKFFEPSKLMENCVVKDFCFHYGIKVPDDFIEQSNKSSSLEAISLLYIYRKFNESSKITAIDYSYKREKYLIEKIIQLPGQKFKLHKDIIKPVLKENSTDIAWMEKRLNLSLESDNSSYASDGIKTESELLQFNYNSLCWLAKQLDSSSLEPISPDFSVQEVADWLGKFREKLSLQS